MKKTLTILALLLVSLAGWAQFDKSQGYRLEIGDGLALDNQSGTITFTPVNKSRRHRCGRSGAPAETMST